MSTQKPISPQLHKALDALRVGRFQLAVQFAKEARRSAPNDPRVLAALGQALARSGNAKAAIPPLQKTVLANPSNFAYRIELANAYDEVADTAQALAQIDTILDADPEHDRAIQHRCSILRRSGRSTEAWQWLKPMLETLPNLAGIALAAAKLAPDSESQDAVLDRVRSCIANPNTDSNTRRSLFYALAKILDRIGQYDQAFAAAQSANKLLPQSDLNQHELLLNRMPSALLESIERPSIDASLAVLVCGMPRSGTTLTEQIIAAHPQVSTVGESPTLGRIVQTIITHAEEHGVVPAELSSKLAKQYLKHLRQDSQPNGRRALRVVDKMPQNIMYLGVVDRLLPGCRVIRCLRDPRDIALSCYMQDFGSAHPYRSTFESLADELIRHERVTVRWKQQTSLAIYEAALEDLTSDPEPRAKALIEFIGLPWDESCLRFHESAGHVKTASVDQVRSGINARGSGRWKKYRQPLAPLLNLLGPILDD